MNITPDQIIFWQWGFIKLNATLIFTWAVMVFMVFGAWLVTRRLSSSTEMSRFQNLLEVVVFQIQKQIAEVSRHSAESLLPFIGTVFLFIAVSNLLMIFPLYEPPTGSLSTTAGLAVCVFIAVPMYGIRSQGWKGYFAHYIRPTIFMLPFNIMGEISRTLALAVRLFGNVMSGTMIIAILLAVAPLIFPILMRALGLLTGLIQAYIFAILATVYIAAVVRARSEVLREQDKGEEKHG